MKAQQHEVLVNIDGIVSWETVELRRDAGVVSIRSMRVVEPPVTELKKARVIRAVREVAIDRKLGDGVNLIQEKLETNLSLMDRMAREDKALQSQRMTFGVEINTNDRTVCGVMMSVPRRRS